MCVAHHYNQRLPFFHRDTCRIVKKAVRVCFVGFRLNIRIRERLIVLHTEVSVILILEHIISQILKERILAVLNIRFRDSRFQVTTRFIFKKSRIIKCIQILGIELHFGTRSKSLPVSCSAFHDKTERLSPDRIIKGYSGSCCRTLKILIQQLRKYTPVFRILYFHFFKMTVISCGTGIINQIIHIRRFRKIIGQRNREIIRSAIRPARMIQRCIVTVKRLFNSIFSLMRSIVPTHHFHFDVTFDVFSRTSIIFIQAML